MTTYFKADGDRVLQGLRHPHDSTFWCCNGTGTENFTKLGDSVYFHDDTDLWVTAT